MAPSVLSYTTLDDNCVKASSPFYAILDGAMTKTEIDAAWVELGALYDAVSGGVIIGGSVTLKQAPDGAWKDTPVAGSDNSDVLELNFSNSVTMTKWGAIVPMLRTALLADARPILTSAGAIDDLVQYLIAAHTTPTFDYCTPEAHDLVALIDAFQGDRKHRRQLKANSTARP